MYPISESLPRFLSNVRKQDWWAFSLAGIRTDTKIHFEREALSAHGRIIPNGVAMWTHKRGDHGAFWDEARRLLTVSSG